MVKPPNLDGPMISTVFHWEFKAEPDQNDQEGWNPTQWPSRSDIIRIPWECWRVITKTTSWWWPTSHNWKQDQLSGKLLREFTVVSDQLAHQALAGLPKDLIQMEANYAFTDWVYDQDLKQHLLMGNKRSLNEALNQVLRLEAVKAAARPPAMLCELWAGARAAP
jgi:hypothetical protein